ncbi:FAD-binding oxidoreductase [Microbacterium sp. No. 7]|uniref:FAD-binding oxidoreductase n=1 Tax=Microbacterium sp. No. 7 TaxID=1714373 RepID=UPI0006D127DC|nr:FAD-binding oxidoreductase [Microbacterium sp. No. 7]
MTHAPLFSDPTDDGRPPFGPDDVDALADDLVGLLGPRGVSGLPRALARAGRDGSQMSPVLSAQPIGHADLVCFPRTLDALPEIVRAAVQHGVPITTRGKGTGNYGQVVPRFGGLVLDMTSLTQVGFEGDEGGDTVTAEAGARMITLEAAAWRRNRQLWMYPSTVQSTIGGFLAGGSAGTGTIVHGRNHMGFVTALDVVYATDEPELVRLEGDAAQPLVHTYGVAGVIGRATVRLEPLQDWRCVYVSYATQHEAFAALRRLAEVTPLPRLLSADGPAIVAALPEDPAFVAGRANLRGIFDEAALPQVHDLVRDTGGRIEAVRDGIDQSLKLSTLSYNHPTWWLQKAHPGVYFHLECSGEALVTRLDEVQAVYPGGIVHLEAGHGTMFGMLNAPFESREQILAGIRPLAELGISVHSPHQWYVDLEPERIRRLAQRTDPHGLLNPGRWMAA